MKQRKDWVALGDTPKPRHSQDLHPKMIMICVWSDWEGIVHWGMLGRSATVTKSCTSPNFTALTRLLV
ncbi:hypothetical protein OESDEN_09640 [Oesophagostomum dentatum]|uniref:Uncharacterized protein n=1 Tax=Oesophagostomum dentatum TaxID=61180 RepID=A0A0B1T407_OESDE|nr:hypothetical protein OESDEN_09640 [Oesophagostomum dentatum]